MPNCHWYGTLNDHHALASLIIARDDVTVMDLYSQNNQQIRSYATADAIIAQCKTSRHFNLWHRASSPRCEITRSQRNDGT